MSIASAAIWRTPESLSGKKLRVNARFFEFFFHQNFDFRQNERFGVFQIEIVFENGGQNFKLFERTMIQVLNYS